MGRRREGSRKAFKIVAGQEVLCVLSVLCGNIVLRAIMKGVTT